MMTLVTLQYSGAVIFTTHHASASLLPFGSNQGLMQETDVAGNKLLRVMIVIQHTPQIATQLTSGMMKNCARFTL